MKRKSIWRLGRESGLWVHERTCEPETEKAWLAAFKKTEPAEVYRLSVNKPFSKVRHSNPERPSRVSVRTLRNGDWVWVLAIQFDGNVHANKFLPWLRDIVKKRVGPGRYNAVLYTEGLKHPTDFNIEV